MSRVLEKVKEARSAALMLANVPESTRNNALHMIAAGIRERGNEIIKANQKDIGFAEELLKRGKIPKPVVQRLKLDRTKLEDTVRMIESVAGLEDPLGKTIYAMELDNELELYKVTCPIGVIGAIFEARPDVLPQISSLCLKSGNSVILKGGKEARYTNRALFETIKDVSERAGMPKGWIQLVEERKDVREMLRLDEYIDLLVPRGSKEFVRYIQSNTRIPVLGHAEGICHVYVDEDVDLQMAVRVCLDAKVQYPAVCNAVEKLLVHKNIADHFLPMIAEEYEKAGVEIRGCERTRAVIKGAKKATEKDWRTEYLDLKITIKVVDSVEEAIDHINRYGSKHTDGIVTKNMKTAVRFLNGVDSSSVMLNASTRFSDGYRYGLGAEVGISTGKIHARGPVGLEGLTTTKYYLLGNGHVVGEFIGPNAKRFSHIQLKRTWRDVISSLEG